MQAHMRTEFFFLFFFEKRDAPPRELHFSAHPRSPFFFFKKKLNQ